MKKVYIIENKSVVGTMFANTLEEIAKSDGLTFTFKKPVGFVDLEEKAEIERQLTDLDIRSIRALRAKATNTATELDIKKLSEIKAEREILIKKLGAV